MSELNKDTDGVIIDRSKNVGPNYIEAWYRGLLESAKNLTIADLILQRITAQHDISENLANSIRDAIRAEAPTYLTTISIEAAPTSTVEIPAYSPPTATDKRERWVDRNDKGESPGHFVLRVYGDIPGLHRGHIREDYGLATAYDRWTKAGFPGAPEGFHLPSKSEAMLNEPAPPPGTTEALRYAERIRKRRQRETKKASER